MPRRIYKDAFIDKQIAAIDEMHERTQRDVIVCPACLDQSDEVSYLTNMDRKQIKAYIKHMRERATVQAFWMGWTLRDGTKDTE